jgi:hypothetical protein
MVVLVLVGGELGGASGCCRRAMIGAIPSPMQKIKS